MNKAKYLKWCKKEAIKLIEASDVGGAYEFFLINMRQRDDTKNHTVLSLGLMLIMGENLSTPDEMCRFINGFK